MISIRQCYYPLHTLSFNELFIGNPMPHIKYVMVIAHALLTILSPCVATYSHTTNLHDDVIKWEHFPRYWPFVRGIHRSPVNSPNKGQWRGALMFSLIYARINTGEACDLRRHHAHYDVIVMYTFINTIESLVQITACHLFGAKPLSKPLLDKYLLEPKEYSSVKHSSKFKYIHSRNFI